MKEEIYGCSERGHAGSWCQSRRYREEVQMENGDSLWQRLRRDKTKGEEDEERLIIKVESRSIIYDMSHPF